MINKEYLKKYAELKRKEKEVADELEKLKPLIVEDLAAHDIDKAETDFGTFTVGTTARWQYSEAVSDLQEQEKANGTAKQVVSTTLRFTAPKK